MEDWTDIPEGVASGKVSKRAILRETGMHWLTLKKILTHSEPPGYRQRKARPQQKLGPYQARIEQILKEDQLLPRKQRHTAKRVWERLTEAGFTGGYTEVKEAVRELTQRNREVFVPLVKLNRRGADGFRPRAGEAERGAAQGGLRCDGAALQRRGVSAGV